MNEHEQKPVLLEIRGLKKYFSSDKKIKNVQTEDKRAAVGKAGKAGKAEKAEKAGKTEKAEKAGKTAVVRAVDGIDLDIYEGETLGLVGESGCGKSTLGRTVLGLYPATEGSVVYYRKNNTSGETEPLELTSMKKEPLRKLRTDLQLIFQDPYSSLNPRMKVGDLIGEGMSVHGYYPWKSKEKDQKVRELMESCGLSPEMADRYPKEFSGGQRQRVSIARALATYPRFVVCDECVSALDVSVQAQIINLLQDLKKQNSLTYLFISHDLSVVRYISDRIGVMYLGTMVELAPSRELFEHPVHPYTQALLSAVPVIRDTAEDEEHEEAEGLAEAEGPADTEDSAGAEYPGNAEHPSKKEGSVRMVGTSDISKSFTGAGAVPIELKGDIPSPVDPPSGCKFHTRCPYASRLSKEQTERCAEEVPAWREISESHFAACHFAGNF